MKKILLQITLIISLFFINNCKAQTVSDYISFYNNVVPKLNSIIPNKTQFYGQNFSKFYNELQNKNINISILGYDTKTDFGTKFYVLKLYFNNFNMWKVASDNSFVFPVVYITFKNEFPVQIIDLVAQSDAQWNPTLAQFFANREIEKIDFIGVKGYNVKDYSE